MRHRDLSKIDSPIPLPNISKLAMAAADKRNRRPISTTRNGRIKCSGRDSQRRVAEVRSINLANANKD